MKDIAAALTPELGRVLLKKVGRTVKKLPQSEPMSGELALLWQRATEGREQAVLELDRLMGLSSLKTTDNVGLARRFSLPLAQVDNIVNHAKRLALANGAPSANGRAAAGRKTTKPPHVGR